MSNDPFLCIVTPVFDPALEALKLLVLDLQDQTNGDFIHILISNGPSPKTKSFIESLNDSRFIYDELAWSPTGGKESLFLNIVKRRDYCFKKYDAQRYLCLDADIKILREDYFEKLLEGHKTGKHILVTKVKYFPWPEGTKSHATVFPKFPVKVGKIDLANFSISKEKAKKHGYPTDTDARYKFANDYRLFTQFLPEDILFLNFISAKKDGNKLYQRFGDISD